MAESPTQPFAPQPAPLTGPRAADTLAGHSHPFAPPPGPGEASGEAGPPPAVGPGPAPAGSIAIPRPVESGCVERLGPFRPIRELGRGAMGVVYLAEQEGLGRPVALKVLAPAIASDPEALGRFQREAQACGRLRHAGIVPVIAVGQEHGIHYLAMEFVEGKTLKQVIQTERIDFDRAADIARQIAEGLHYAHENGILHRDIKPANVLITRVKSTRRRRDKAGDGGGDRRSTAFGFTRLRARETASTVAQPRPGASPEDTSVPLSVAEAAVGDPGFDDRALITDFGLARDMASAGLTQTGMIVGTPMYMAPEQAGDRTHVLDGRTDVYAVGATLYEMVTLRPPFGGDKIETIIAKVLLQDPEPPRRLRPDLPRDLETILLHAMEKDPARRYESALALAEDLERFLRDEPIHARPPGRLDRAVRLVRRHRAMSALVAALMLAVLTGPSGFRAYRRSIVAEQVETGRRIMARAHADTAGIPEVPGTLNRRESEALAQAASLCHDAAESFRAALRFDPESEDARHALADLFGLRLRMLRRSGDRTATRDWAAQAGSFFAVERFREELTGRGSLTLASRTAGAEAWIAPWQDPVDPSVGRRALGPLPIKELPLEPGVYLLLVRAPGHVPALSVLTMGWEEPVTTGARLYPDSPRTADMAYVPDPDGDFFIDRFEVTCGQYRRFLEAEPDPIQRRLHTPLNWPDGRMPEAWDRLPVTTVSWESAMRYAQWTGKRLPGWREWSRAAVATAGIPYPWGSRFIRDHARVREADEPTGPSPVGSHPLDRSLHGCYDMVGNVAEWLDREGAVSRRAFLAGNDFAHSGIRRIDKRGEEVGIHEKFEYVGFRCAMNPPDRADNPQIAGALHLIQATLDGIPAEAAPRLQAEALVREGNRLFVAGRLDETLGLYNEAVMRAPDWAAPRYNRALLFLARRAFELALEDLDRVERAAPDFHSARILRAGIYHFQEQWDPSATALGQVADRVPLNPFLCGLRAFALLGGGRLKAAARDFKRFIVGVERLLDLLRELELEDRLQFSKGASVRRSFNAMLADHMGKALDYRAEEDLEFFLPLDRSVISQLFDRNPDHEAVLRLRLNLLMNADPDLSIRVGVRVGILGQDADSTIARLADRPPGEEDRWVRERITGRGICHAARERWDEARAEFSRVIEQVDPGYAPARIQRAILELDRARSRERAGDRDGAQWSRERALADLDALLEREPGSAEARTYRAVALLRLGRREEALAAIGKAWESDPSAAEVHLRRGEILRALGRVEEAEEAWREAARLQPIFAELVPALAGR